MLAVMRMVSPEKSTKVTRPGVGLSGSAGGGDDDGELLWLGSGTYGIDGTDYRAVGVAATRDGDQSCGCQGEAGC